MAFQFCKCCTPLALLPSGIVVVAAASGGFRGSVVSVFLDNVEQLNGLIHLKKKQISLFFYYCFGSFIGISALTALEKELLNEL